MNRLRTLFSFRGEISRLGYMSVAFVGVLVKHAIDLIVAGRFHRSWDFTHYLVPLGVPVTPGRLTPDDLQFLTAMLVVSVPFAWVGLEITARRFRTIGWPLWARMVAIWPHRYGPSSRIHGLAGGSIRPGRTPWRPDAADRKDLDQHHLWPAAYWRLWSDAIVHSIHYRVLSHIKELSERRA